MKYFFFILTLIYSTAVLPYSCRSSKVKHQFDVQQGYPHGRPGYIVDHVCALKCGGIDSPINMQYQTVEESHKKDRWETTPEGCKKTCNAENSTPNRNVFNCN